MQTLKTKFLLYLSILSFIHFEFVESVCLLKYPPNTETAPIYVKHLGKYTIHLPLNGKDIELNDGEKIEAICRTTFSPISYTKVVRDRYGYVNQNTIVLSNATSISLTCRENKIYYNSSILEDTKFRCNRLNWSVYDATEPYEWCEKYQNTKTFLLAAKSNQDHHVLGGICFNLNEWSLLTITYNVTNSGQKNNLEMQRDITKTLLKSTQSLGDYLWDYKIYYFDLSSSDLEQQLTELTKTNSWLILANYELSPIVQGDSYTYLFNEYRNILNIIWWRNLRLGNWKLFMNTLENYAYKNNFQVYTGTSGIAKVPTKNTADYDYLRVKNNNLNVTVPEYIWTYLTSTDNLNEDFVIIGYNSPYAEWFNVNDVIFCPNICSQISWLREIYSSFQYATAGIMFCCSPDFVQKNNNLYGFPKNVAIERAARKQSQVEEIENISTLTSFIGADTTEQSEVEITEQSDVAATENSDFFANFTLKNKKY